MELWDVYDIDRNKTGKIVAKNELKSPLQDNEYGMVVDVAIFNSNNEMLIQKRQTTKSKYPNLWDISAGGHALAGESSQEAIERELFEELGYRYDFSEERPYFTINYKKDFGDIYILNIDNIDLSDLKIQVDEVQNVTWATKDEILQLIEENKFIPYCSGYIELLFLQREKRGLIK